MATLKTDVSISPLSSHSQRKEKPDIPAPDANMKHRFEQALHRRPKDSGATEEEANCWLMAWQQPVVAGDISEAEDAGATAATASGSSVRQAQQEPPTSLLKPVPLGELHVRLSQGPLSGMEIHASLENGALLLRLAVSDQRRMEKLSTHRERLASLLAEMLDCPVMLEVKHVASAS